MDLSLAYIIVAVVALVVVALLVILTNRHKQQKRLTPLAGLAFAFIMAGIVFGDSRLVGYGLMGIGVLLAVIDMVQKATRAA